ncbi:MAG TPA: hypothetical protein VLT62_02805 [Candidatus Methylomirabilis sp.]|nr:hypothetical protein [Candidatus Methylomirabilis sp.]
MPYQATVGRMTSVEFFASIPPGLFVFLVSYTCLVSASGKEPPPSLWGHLMALSNALKESPPLILFVIFGAYLIGSVIRSMPVQWAESVTAFGRKHSRFPYSLELVDLLQRLDAQSGATDLEAKGLPKFTELTAGVFNYWKDFLCIKAPEGFVYYQTFEARSRFYTGMFWAGVAGVAGFIVMLGLWGKGGISLVPATQLLVLSVILVVAFGLQLWRVREQEARVLLMLFVVARKESVATVSG